jgi:hypothetical protein
LIAAPAIEHSTGLVNAVALQRISALVDAPVHPAFILAERRYARG